MGLKGELGDGFPQPKPAFIIGVSSTHVSLTAFFSFKAFFLLLSY